MAIIFAAFYFLLADPREKTPMLINLIHLKSPFNRMRLRHEMMKERYPDKPNAKGIPLTGLSNARPETLAIQERVRRNIEAMPFGRLSPDRYWKPCRKLRAQKARRHDR